MIEQINKNNKLVIAGQEIGNRFFLGSGKFGRKEEFKTALEKNKIDIVTVAMRRVDIDKNEDNVLNFIPKDTIILVNTSGARNAEEAVRIARLAKESSLTNWIKIEVINDSKYLLPDNFETIKATEQLASEGFVVLPYMNPDLYVARELVKAGAAAVMPLGSLIGTNQGIKMKTMLEVLIQEIKDVPIIVDAGIGTPSQAAEAMEIGADAVLVNTAVATAENPVLMCEAFSKAVEAGHLAYLAKLGNKSDLARASSPLTGFLHE